MREISQLSKYPHSPELLEFLTNSIFLRNYGIVLTCNSVQWLYYNITEREIEPSRGDIADAWVKHFGNRVNTPSAAVDDG